MRLQLAITPGGIPEETAALSVISLSSRNWRSPIILAASDIFYRTFVRRDKGPEKMVALKQARPSTHSAATFSRKSRENLLRRNRSAAHFSQSLQRARYYDPSTGEFTGRDPLEYINGESLYRGFFVQIAVDPSGLFRITNEEVIPFTDYSYVKDSGCSFFRWESVFQFVLDRDEGESFVTVEIVFGIPEIRITLSTEFPWSPLIHLNNGYGIGIVQEMIQQLSTVRECVACDGTIKNEHFSFWETMGYFTSRPGLFGRDQQIFGLDGHADGHSDACFCRFIRDMNVYLGWGIGVLFVPGGGGHIFGGSVDMPPDFNKGTPRFGIPLIDWESATLNWGYQVWCSQGECRRIHEYGFLRDVRGTGRVPPPSTADDLPK